MKKLIKRSVALLLAVMVLAGTAMTVMAANWQQDATGWWYDNGNGTWPANSWQWIDGNGDGVAECYYFDGNGYMLSNTTTPDGFQVNASGAWTVNGIVQTQGIAANNGGTTGAVSGYNADGISNIAIDLLHSTRDEANAKYGPEKMNASSATPFLTYPNGFKVDWRIKSGHEQAWEQDPNNMSNYYISRVTCAKPSDMANFLTSADDNKTPSEMKSYLKTRGYDVKGNDLGCYLVLGNYQIQFYENYVELVTISN